ncbi:ABC transporter substrate-binding protein [Cohnella yongneupensis]|uniref:ABC transporter substrate-binding protein n=1 Tax=Cohnella yongneupensis TaxID=425006 RepID=A0ABW0QSY9_9BACL
MRIMKALTLFALVMALMFSVVVTSGSAAEKKIDMKGKTFTILTWVKEDVPSNKTKEGALRLARQKEVEKKYNVKVKWQVVPWGKSIEMLTNAGLAGEPVADIMLLDLYFSPAAIKQGLLRPVDDLFDFKDKKWPKDMTTYGKIYGKTYGFKDYINVGAGMYYNKTMFKKLGLPDPNQLYQSGKWDWKAFKDIAIKATKDTNGDGQIDQWGITNDAGILARLLVSSNGGNILTQKNGKYVYTGDDKKAMEALNYLNDLFNKSKVAAPNKGTDDWTGSQKLFSAGKAAMIAGDLWEAKERKEMTDDQGFVPFPKGPSSTSATYFNAVENFTMYYMPTNVKTPKESAKIWEELILWDRVDKNKKALFEDQGVASPQDVQNMIKATELGRPLFVPGMAGAAWYGAVQKEIAMKGTAPETALAKVKQTAIADIETTLNKK